MADYINVTSLNRLAKRVLEQCDPLNDLIVCGEISGFTRHYKSGHLYFTLKDENASIKTVMFRSQAQLLNFEPQNGMLVLVYGRATIYERDGAFQLYADYMKPFGAGAAQMAFDALYKRLEAEGLFAPERKRPLPAVPRCIGVVTSKTGAAWQDVQNVIARRWPGVQLLLAPVSAELSREEAAAVLENKALLERCGFETEDFGGGDILIRQIPSDVDVEDAKALLQELAGDLLAGKTLDPDSLRDNLLHTIACKSAIKAGWLTSDEELRRLVQEVLSRDDIKYCPHGRPVCVTLTKRQLEKQFKRV